LKYNSLKIKECYITKVYQANEQTEYKTGNKNLKGFLCCG